MKWVVENLGLVIVLAIAAVSFVRGIFRAAKGGGEAPPRPRPRMEDPESEARTRRVQEEIRRKIAERRGELSSRTPPQVVPARGEERRAAEPPPLLPPPVRPLDPFGGPARRVAEALEQAAKRRFEEDEAAKLEEAERQQALEVQMRALETARAVEQRRAEAAMALARGKVATAGPIEIPATGLGLKEWVRDRRELRRAIVLREVLGPPVGLR